MGGFASELPKTAALTSPTGLSAATNWTNKTTVDERKFDPARHGLEALPVGYTLDQEVSYRSQDLLPHLPVF
jgi:hypothetical protein